MQEFLPVLPAAKSSILTMYKKHTKKGRKKMAKRKTGKKRRTGGTGTLKQWLTCKKKQYGGCWNPWKYG